MTYVPTPTNPETTVEQVDEQAQAWIAASFSDPHGDWQSRFSAENMVTAYRAGFAAGLGHARTVFMAPSSAKPECPYCGATEGLRIKSDGGGIESPEYTCEACFTGTDTGPCFDDLPEVRAS